MIPIKDTRADEVIAANWIRVKGLGLLPGVENREQYEVRVWEGMKRASAFLKADGVVVPTTKGIETVHWEVFKDVHPWAGRFRLPGQQVTTSWGAEGAHPQKIKELLSHIVSIALKAFAKKGDEEKLKAVALYHCGLMSIHPFLDGNTRVAWVISEAQMRQAFGEHVLAKAERKQYIDALRIADERLDHLPFETMLREGISLRLPSDLPPTPERACEHETALLAEKRKKISDVLSTGTLDKLYGLSSERLRQELDQAKEKRQAIDEIERKISHAKACNERMDRNDVLIRQREGKVRAVLREGDQVSGARNDHSATSDGAEIRRQQEAAAQNQKEQNEQKRRRGRER